MHRASCLNWPFVKICVGSESEDGKCSSVELGSRNSGAISTALRRLEGTVTISVELGPDGHAETLPEDHRDRASGRPAHPGGTRARARPVVLGSRGHNRGKPGRSRSCGPRRRNGPRLASLGAADRATDSMIKSTDLPNLNESTHKLTSPQSPEYNCVAWAASDTEHWWQPGVYWPVEAEPDTFGLGALIEAFAARGFVVCETGEREQGFQKVALYELSSYYTHAARQLPDGRWTSKLGRSEDIEHEHPEDLAGGVYGEVAAFMRCPSNS